MMSFPATPEWLVTWHLWLSECLKKCAWNSGCIILSGGATWETAMEMNGNAIGYFLQELQTSWVNKLLQDIIAKRPSLRKKWHCSKTDLSWQINFCHFHSSVKILFSNWIRSLIGSGASAGGSVFLYREPKKHWPLKCHPHEAGNSTAVKWIIPSHSLSQNGHGLRWQTQSRSPAQLGRVKPARETTSQK